MELIHVAGRQKIKALFLHDIMCTMCGWTAGWGGGGQTGDKSLSCYAWTRGCVHLSKSLHAPESSHLTHRQARGAATRSSYLSTKQILICHKRGAALLSLAVVQIRCARTQLQRWILVMILKVMNEKQNQEVNPAASYTTAI